MTLDEYTKAYDQYFHLARKIAENELHDFHLAGDTAQEVFTEMYLKKEFLDFRQIKYWIILNASRRARDHIKKSYRRHEVLLEDEKWKIQEPLNPIFSEDIILRKEYLQYQYLALEALKNYNKNWYEFLIHYHINNKNYKSLSKMYGLQEQNLRVQVHRARKWLDKKINELYENTNL